MELYFTHF